MTSTRSMEGSGGGKNASTADKLHRGRNVQLAFLMQGWGQFFNQVVLIILLLIFHSQAGPPYTTTSTQWTYRVSFATILPFTLYLIYYRFYKVRYADATLSLSKKRLNTSGYDVKSLRMATSHYWPRLLATAGGWFCNDFFFYGNKIFQGQFISIIAPGKNIMTGWLYNLVNIGCSLVGYYAAAWYIDHKFYGRKRMQSVGFMMDFICFIIPAFAYSSLTKRGAGVKWFEFLYFFSSFWNQFGPNAITVRTGFCDDARANALPFFPSSLLQPNVIPPPFDRLLTALQQLRENLAPLRLQFCTTTLAHSHDSVSWHGSG
jgi:hypothetical protein